MELIALLIAGFFFLAILVLGFYLLILSVFGGGLLLMLIGLGMLVDGEIANGLWTIGIGLVMVLIGGSAISSVGSKRRIL